MARRHTPLSASPEVTDAVRQNILDVSTTEFADHGFAGARVDTIAAKTLTSKRMIYYHFGSKDGLYRAVLERAYAGIRTAELHGELEGLDAMDALSRMTTITLDYHAAHPEFVRLVMDENMRRGSQIETFEARGGGASILSILEGLLQRGYREGVFRPGIDALQLHMLMSALAFFPVSNRYTLSAYLHHRFDDPDARAAQRAVALDAVLRYCRLDTPIR